MSKLANKQCSLFKEKCLVENCAQYDERLDACAWNLLPFNMYKIAHAIEQALPESPPTQPAYPRYSGRR